MNRPSTTRTALRSALASCLLALGACEATQLPRSDMPLDVREPFVATDPVDRPPQPLPEPVVPVVVRPPRPTIGDAAEYAFEFRDTPATDALRMIADRAGLNFVVPDGVTATVTASLPKVTLDQALKVVLDRAALDIAVHDGIWTVEPAPDSSVETRAFRAGAMDITGLEVQVRAILGENEGSVTINPQQNLLYVTAPTALMTRVVEFFERLDREPREVLIEARIVEVALDENFEFGANMTFGDSSVAATTSRLLSDFLQESDNFSVRTVGDTSQITAVLRAIQEFGRLHVIASPRVLAINQELAKIEILERIPYIESTNTTTGDTTGVSTSSVQQVEFEEVGIRLHVTPVLAENKTVILKVMQEVSEVIDFFAGVPVTDTRLVDTRFVVNDRETIVIGGLLKERTRKDEAGVPILMDVPLIGRLFRGETSTRENVELLVFMTPRIVRPGEVSGINSEFKRELQRKSEEYRQDYRETLDDIR
jgi:type II secretory pathway component GspD/PulD (secretin)